MSIILNIESSTVGCSAAVGRDGAISFSRSDSAPHSAAEKLAPFVEECLEDLHRQGLRPEAVAVALGPGSYTGLRIALSLAKGLAYGLDVPLIGIDTLKILVVKAMFRNMEWRGDEIVAPMIDARRMEVFTGAYNFALEAIEGPAPMVLDSESYADLLSDRDVWFVGDGAEKAKSVIHSPHAHWIDGLHPNAVDMLALSEKAFREGDFIDKAYSVPAYLKAYQTTIPKKKV